MQRNAHVSESRTHIDDAASIAWVHPSKRSHGPPDLAEKRHLNGPLEVVGGDLPRRSKDGRHGVVHPDVDRPQFVLDQGRGRVDLLEIADVRGDDYHSTALGLDLLRRALESRYASGEKRYVEPRFSKGPGGRSTDPPGGTSHYGNRSS